jgi:ATP-dependent RNA circularization protein (DNA/RNA ligase family)
MTELEVAFLLEKEVSIEEKIDGANLGISLTMNRELKIQNRGQYLEPPFIGQFSRLSSWLTQHGDLIASELNIDLIIFGEWCAAKHSLSYTKLPNWFILFDVYDRSRSSFWCCSKRNQLGEKLGLPTPAVLYYGRADVQKFKDIMFSSASTYGEGPVEGLIIRRDSKSWCEAKGKLVRPDFTQAIEEHWRKRTLEWNRLKPED